MSAADKGIDLGYLFLDTIEPYSEDLGLKKDAEKVNNEQKIKTLANIMPVFADEVDKIADIFEGINQDVQKVSSGRYRVIDKLLGQNISGQIKSTQDVLQELSTKSPKFKLLFEQIPEFVGLADNDFEQEESGEGKNYLVFMANNSELRMPGGFWTYSVLVNFKQGVPAIVKSIDTYFIDVDNSSLVEKNVPYFLSNYLKVDRLYARDANSISPDFTEGVDFFISRFWNQYTGSPNNPLGNQPLPKLDGVMQVNIKLAEDLLEVLGPVSVEGKSYLTDDGTYKGFSTSEFNTENLFYSLEKIANSDLAEQKGRKDVISFLMDSLIQKTLTIDTENPMDLVRVFLDGLASKDITIYSFNPSTQQAFRELGYTGTFIPTKNKSDDYLFVNHSNLGGGKRDRIIERETSKKVYEENGVIKSTVKIKVVNPKSPSWWQSSWLYTYRDYVRVYVPKGSKLLSVTSSDGQDVGISEQNEDALKLEHEEKHNLEFFEVFFTVAENDTIEVTFDYELPDYINLQDYKLLIQKQSGVSNDDVKLDINNVTKNIILNADTYLEF